MSDLAIRVEHLSKQYHIGAQAGRYDTLRDVITGTAERVAHRLNSGANGGAAANTIWALVLVYLTFNLAIVIWMMQGFFEAVPAALEEAAWLDGCGIWSAFWHVTLPLTRPGLVATAVLCFIFSWSDFFFALILTRTQAVTAPVAIVNFLQYDGWEWGKIAAAGCLVMLPVLLFTVLVRKYLVHGLTAGGVKD